MVVLESPEISTHSHVIVILVLGVDLDCIELPTCHDRVLLINIS